MIVAALLTLMMAPVDSHTNVVAIDPDARPLLNWMPKRQDFECWLAHENGKNGTLSFSLSGGEVYPRSSTDQKKASFTRWEVGRKPMVFTLGTDSLGELTGYRMKPDGGLPSDAFAGEIEFELPGNPELERKLLISKSNASLAPTYEGSRPIYVMGIKNDIESGRIAMQQVRPLAIGFCSLTATEQRPLTPKEIEGLTKK